MAYAFAVALDRAVEWRERDAELARLLQSPKVRWLNLREDAAACIASEGRLMLVAGSAVREPPAEWVFLGQREDHLVFSAACLGVDSANEDWLDLRTAASTLQAPDAGLFAYACAMCAWRRRQRFCGACSAPMLAEAGGHRLRCAACGMASFPRTDPAIIVAVRNGERVLLGRQATWPPGRYSTLAGFVEPGETLEAAVAREVQEESGVLIAASHYVGSQPWPFPASLMIGFEAEAASTAITLGEELEDARWFDPDQYAAAIHQGLLLPPTRTSIAHWLVERWFQDVAGQSLPEPGRLR